MKFITQDNVTYMYLPGGKRYIRPNEYMVVNSGAVYQWTGSFQTGAKLYRVLPVQDIIREKD